ncbi:N-methyltryptophan oxidase [Saccharopolyspora subtropica]|uniref:N-methyl-L-tryptophan oxidase n=1 Tax=Saccharopolyspora thermophila TaxID=89367 RepID=A0A917JWZ7_9PSEU|nr:N-methyltryptophan oxidase [Saccharopolyspora subtropica]
MRHAQVGIIGTGTIGSMLAWRLARRGVDVLAFEQFSPGHDRGAVGGETRLFRLAYAEGPQYAPLLRRSLELWRELQAESGDAVLHQCGGLTIGDPAGDYVRGLLDSARVSGTAVRVLSTAEAAERYPQHRLLDGEVAVLDEQAGYLRCEQAVLSATRVAEQAGAQVLRYTEVVEIAEDDDSVLVRTADGAAYRVGRVVVAAGSWAARFLPADLAAAVEPRRLLLTWFGAEDIDQYRPERFPIFIHHSRNAHLYGTPTVDGVMVKVAGAVTAHPVPAPEAVDRRHSLTEVRAVAAAVERVLPGLHPQPIRTDAFTDLYTTDGQALVGPVGGGRVVLATGHSGRGFKYAPGVADAVADLLTGAAGAGCEFLSPSRLR